MRIRPELALVALLLGGACTAAPPPQGMPPAPAAAPLDDSSVQAIARLLAMQDERVLDSALVRYAFAHPRVEVRTQAALAAGRIGDHAVAPALRAALADSSAEVAANAAFALGELNDSSGATRAALAAQLEAAAWARPLVAAEAAHALGKVGGAPGQSALEGVLAADAPAVVLHEALLAIWRLPRSSQSATAVLAHLSADEAETRWRAAYALMRMGVTQAMRALRGALADDDYRVRAFAARALRAAPVDSAGERAATVAALDAAIDDAHPHVVINAARALASYRDPSRTARLVALLASDNPHIAVAAAEALVEQRDPAVASVLRDVASGRTVAGATLSLRAAALAGAIRLEPRTGVTQAAGWAADPAWLTRLYGARALGGAPWPDAAPVLAQLIRDADVRVAAEALGAVASADTLGAGYAFYIEGLASHDVMVRAAAARGLSRHAGPADLPVLLAAYERAQADSLTDAALAIVNALGELKTGGMPVERSFFTRFTRSPVALVRQAVSRTLGDAWGNPLPVETARTLADYEDVVRVRMAPVIEGAPPPRIRIRMGRGDIVLTLAPLEAPLTVANMIGLIEDGFYAAADLRWHRVVPNFVLQDGDSRGDGSGGPAHAIRDEMNRLRYGRGVLGMALSGPDTGGSQFFITHSPQPHLDGGYTVFGRVTEGMDVADAVLQDERILAIEVVE